MQEIRVVHFRAEDQSNNLRCIKELNDVQGELARQGFILADVLQHPRDKGKYSAVFMRTSAFSSFEVVTVH